MLSNWISRVGSSFVKATSPKALLASYLASSLSEFFQVDVNKIHSNLLSDTKIALNNVRLKPFPLNPSTANSSNLIIVVGAVDEIVFSWIWGGSPDGSTPFIRETTLSIRGLRLRVKKQGGFVSLHTNLRTQQPSSDSHPTENNIGCIQLFVNQIIDHMTLNIVDVEVVVDCGELAASNNNEANACLVVATKSLQLVSFGRDAYTVIAVTQEEIATSPLLQRISMNSVAAYITTNCELNDAVDSGAGMSRISLMEPFSYSASVKRVGWRRFMDGIASGLEVVGEIVNPVAASTAKHRGKRSKDTRRLVLHAGSQQVQLLCSLANLFNPTRRTTAASKIYSQQGRPVDTQLHAWQESAAPATKFILPLPSLVLWLPNGSLIQMPNCTLEYRMDGSLFSLHGADGIHINGQHDFIRLRETTRWLLDFARCRALLQPCSYQGDNESMHEFANCVHGHNAEESASTSKVAQVQWEEVEMKKLLRGIVEFLSLVSADLDDQVNVPHGSMCSSQHWLFAFDGIISVKVEGATGWVNASIKSSSVNLAFDEGGRPRDFQVGGVTIGPTSFGAFSILLPPLAKEAESREVTFQGPAEVHVQSSSVIDAVYHFIRGALNIDSLLCDIRAGPAQGVKPEAGKAAIDPFFIWISNASVSLLEPNVAVAAQRIRIQDLTKMQCDVLTLTSKDPFVLASAAGIHATWDPAIKLRISSIESMSVGSVAELAQPIHDTTVGFDGAGVLQVDLTLVRVNTPLLGRSLQASTNSSLSLHGLASPLLPFPIHIKIQEVAAKHSNLSKCYWRLSSINLTATPSNQALFITTCSSIGIYLQAPDKNWLKASIGDFSVLLNPPFYTPTEINCNGIEIGPCSYGIVSMKVPSIGTTPEMKQIQIAHDMEVSLDSIQVANRLKEMLSEAFGLTSLQTTSAPNKKLWQLPVALPGIKVDLKEHRSQLKLNDLMIKWPIVQCGSVIFNSSDVSAILSGAQATLSSAVILKLHKIEGFRVEGLVVLDEPTSDVVVSARSSERNGLTSLANQQSSDSLSIAVQLMMQEVDVRLDGERCCSVHLSQINIFAVSVNMALSIKSTSPISIRLQSAVGEWLESTIYGFNAVLPHNFCYPSSLSCEGMLVGPSSMGQILARLPPFSMNSKLEVSLLGDIATEVRSAEVLGHLKKFINSVLVQSNIPVKHASTTLSVGVPQVILDIEEPEVRFILDKVCIDEENFSCGNLVMTDPCGMSARLSGIFATMPADVVAGRVNYIETLNIPNTFKLEKPAKHTRFSINTDNSLLVHLTSLHIVALESSSQASTISMIVPFPICATIEDLAMRAALSSNQITRLQFLDCRVQPMPVDPISQTQQSGAMFQIVIKTLENKLMNLHNAQAAGVVYKSQPNVVHRLHVSVESLKIVAGFASVDWASILFGEPNEATVLMLPHAYIEPMQAKMSYKGALVATKETFVRIPRFFGGPNTTSKDVLQHFSQSVLAKVPSFLANTELFGENVVDTAAMQIGRAAIRATVASSTDKDRSDVRLAAAMGGSVVGLVAADSVRSIIANGKKSRRATENDDYRFGDFTRGIFHSIQQCAQIGGESAGGEYAVGDFSTGAAYSTGKYVAKNTSRLGLDSGWLLARHLPALLLDGQYQGLQDSLGPMQVGNWAEVSLKPRIWKKTPILKTREAVVVWVLLSGFIIPRNGSL